MKTTDSGVEGSQYELDVVEHADHVELLPDWTRPIGNRAWIRVDRDTFVSDVTDCC